MHQSFVFPQAAVTEVFHQQVEQDAWCAALSLPFRLYYQFARPLLPIPVRQLLQSRRPEPVEEAWYLPQEFFERLGGALNAESALPVVHPWPQAASFALVLTHDVETAAGMRNLVPLMDLEEELGFRSSFNLVPYKYPIDPGIVREMQARGFEIGIHGYNHDGRLYASRRIFERRAPAINAAIRRYGAVGFRSPMVHRNLEWLQSLEIEYDASCFDIDPYQAMPGGVGGLWPFVAGRFVELPYTLPQDHTLLIARGERDDRIWREKLRFIRRRRGMALMLTHPDYLETPARLNVYRQFLRHVRDKADYWHALPREVVAWWRRRDVAQRRWLAADRDSVATLDLEEGVSAQLTVESGKLTIRVPRQVKETTAWEGAEQSNARRA